MGRWDELLAHLALQPRENGSAALAQFAAEATSRVDPVTDDRPFFFARQKPWGLPSAMGAAFLTILLPIGLLCGLFVARGRPAGTPVATYSASKAAAAHEAVY